MNTIPTVRELMTTKVISLKPDLDMQDAMRLLLQHRISGAPVVNSDNELVGILSEKDCLRLFSNSAFERTPVGTVQDYMSKKVQTIRHDIDLFGAAGIFFQHSFRRMPVLENGKLIGLISRPDVLKGALALYQNFADTRPKVSADFIPEQVKGMLKK